MINVRRLLVAGSIDPFFAIKISMGKNSRDACYIVPMRFGLITELIAHVVWRKSLCSSEELQIVSATEDSAKWLD